jgi:hypothetical protein
MMINVKKIPKPMVKPGDRHENIYSAYLINQMTGSSL